MRLEEKKEKQEVVGVVDDVVHALLRRARFISWHDYKIYIIRFFHLLIHLQLFFLLSLFFNEIKIYTAHTHTQSLHFTLIP